MEQDGAFYFQAGKQTNRDLRVSNGRRKNPMKWTFTLIALGAVALFGISATAQKTSPKAEEVFQVKRNILVTDAAGAKLFDLNVEDLKISEDGSEQKPVNFTANTSPLLLEIVLDDSGSMASQMKHMIAIAKFIVENLEQDTHVQIVRFGNLERVKLENEWSSDKQLLLKELDERRSQGMNSPVHDGLFVAIDQLKQAKLINNDARAAIILISDCMESGSTRNQGELFEELRKSDIPLFVVAMTDSYDLPNQAFVKALADKQTKVIELFAHTSALLSGGSAYFPRKGDNAKLPLTETLKDLVTELRAQYVMTYVPTNQNRDEKERKVSIALSDSIYGDKRVGTFKQTYLVPAQKLPPAAR